MNYSVDGFVIRTVFQPLADRLAPRISTFNIARFFCDGMLVYAMAVALRAVAQQCSTDTVVRLLSLAIVVVVYRLILWLVEIEWAYDSPHQGRRFFLVTRLLAMVGLAFCMARWDVSGTACAGLLVCSAYFSSCALNQRSEAASARA